MAAIFGLLAGYWLAVWMRGQRGGEQEPSPLAPLWLRLRVFGGALWRLLSPALGRMREPLADAGTRMGPALAEMSRQAGRQLSKLSPLPYWRRLVELAVHALPRSLRFWFCVRSLRHEAEPARWSLSLKSRGCKHLGLSPQVPLSKLGAGLVAFVLDDDFSLRLLFDELTDQFLAFLEAGDFFGEMSVFENELRSATVRAAGEAILDALDGRPGVRSARYKLGSDAVRYALR